MGLTQSQTPFCKKQKEQRIAPLLLALYPPPGTSPTLLLHDCEGYAVRRSRFGRITRCSLFEPEHGILHRAEIAVPGLVPGLGCTPSRVDQRRNGAVVLGVKQVAALRVRSGTT